MRCVSTVDSLTEFAAQIHQTGFVLWQQYVSEELLADLRAACERSSKTAVGRRGTIYARRNLLAELPEVAALATSQILQQLVATVLGPGSSVVRGLLFDKVPAANWHVGWHQDLMIPLAKRHELPGYSAWSVKAGLVHVRPPLEVLRQMLTLRIHLDDCTAESGPLRLIAQSHLRADWTEQEKLQAAEQLAQVCVAPAGGILAMRPLVLHASSPATVVTHRRVIHLEYAAASLPKPLQWPDSAIKLSPSL